MISLALAAVLALSVASSAAPAKKLPYTKVSASSGPLSLTLRVLSRQKSPNEALYYQLELRNVGKEPVILGDNAFQNSSAIALNSREGMGAHLEVKIPSGRVPANARPNYDAHSEETEVRPGPLPPSKEPGPIELAPGKSALVRCERRKTVFQREWCELGFWLLYEQGTSRIRAVYKGKRSGGVARILADVPERPEEVDVVTPWISFQVGVAGVGQSD